MESNSKEGNSGKPRETVTLVLKEERFEVEKQKLIDKSQYFAALLSANFLEYGQTEHIVNYDISSILLQDFIGWTHDKIAFTSATSYDFEELDRLLSLLELGILFAADKLIEDITDRLERHFMLPIYAIKIWLLAQKLNINVLRDLSLAVCLDRFDELPLDSIYELSKEHFMKLIGNINLRATESHLLDITREWMNHRHDFTIPLYILEKKKQKILQGIISCEDNNGEQYIHCWDGNDFFELTSFKYPPDIVEHSSISSSLEGMQITARKYQLYLCGGEYGIGSGIFNKNVWRYSLISKKWILETIMPVERRNMITVFLKDKLHLVGGVGRYQQELKTIDIYNIYTGVCTSSRAKIPYTFTSVPDHFIFNDKLIICGICDIYDDILMNILYIYLPDEDVWKTTLLERINSDLGLLTFIPSDTPPILTLKTMSCYIDVVDRDKMVLKTIAQTCNVEGCNNIIKTFSRSTLETEKKSDMYEEDHLYPLLPVECYGCSFLITPFFHEYCKPPAILLCTRTERHNLWKLHLHSIPIREPRKFRSLFFTKKNRSRRFFNLLHPADLQTTILDRI
ncbi:uncharacterized protein LOC112466695 isoform X1 [Temnothorax curvispinosus]|uniref:Uncharacterized protein LOC112466695 isoform X1 n=2 Tax=Temnothorax curvispinosus TaxID=300111 RepID=A0A6J1RCT7_9HYME|nr:uncharacterized protein LOC112466695 isoform X1 [Temnothorax curvispinosus]